MTTTSSTPTALLGAKLGMTQVWDEAGRLVPVTVVQVGTNVVTQVRTRADRRVRRRAARLRRDRPAQGDQAPQGPLREGRRDPAPPPGRGARRQRAHRPGQELTAEVFDAGQRVDVVGTTKGKGFAGVMKRHGFSGVGASHGAHRNHRKPGSIGACATPSRVFKGVRMAGRMGHERQTTQNLTVHAVDAEKGLLLVKGAVPGPRGGLVLVRTAAKGA